MKRRTILSVGLCGMLLACALTASAQDADDKALYDRWAAAMEKRLPDWDAHKTKWKEDIGWQAAPMLRGLVKGYAWSGDPRWLAHLTRQIDEMMARIKVETIPNSTSDKPFPGWGHSITGEALVIEPILEFIELAQTDAKVPDEYKKKAAEYLARIEPALITKWDEAGRWADTHLDCGTYIEGISLPHNKNAHLGTMILLAARVTPSQQRRIVYLDKAARLARRWKKFLKVQDDFYLWHYWDAAGAWDFDETGKSRHWTSLEHRGYAVSDTAFVAAAYDHGLVFDRDDIARHCRTFLKKIWNGDEANPVYRAQGWFNSKYVNCGVFTGMAPYDANIMALWKRDVQKAAEGWGGMTGVPAYLLAKRRGIGFQRDHSRYGEMLSKALGERQPPKKPQPPMEPSVR